MKKILVCALVLAMFLTLCACGTSVPSGEVTTAVTWEQLLAANTLEAIFETAGGFAAITTDGSEETYVEYAAMVDGKIIAATGTEGNTEDIVDGFIYRGAFPDEEKSITIIPDTANPIDYVDGRYGEELAGYDKVGDIRVGKDGKYIVEFFKADAEDSFETKGYALFDPETLLMSYMKVTHSIGSYSYTADVTITYGDIEFETVSYDTMINAEDTIEVTVHYTDGSTKDIIVERDATVMAYHSDLEQIWSVCGDQECTSAIDDFGAIEGEHGDVYLFNGDLKPAAPALRRVLKFSTFDAMYKRNYYSYIQNIYFHDGEENVQGVIDVAWHEDEADGPCVCMEIRDSEYEVIESSRAVGNVLYSWSKENGFAVDFFNDFAYADELAKQKTMQIDEQKLTAEPVFDEWYFYIPYEETDEEGNTVEYRYCIHPDMDYIDRVEITRKDSEGVIFAEEEYYIGGNGPLPNEIDLVGEITSPADQKVVKLTVVSADGEKTYSVRKDAAISMEGNALYSDEACTKAVEDLEWVEGDSAKVYVK